MKLSSRRTAGVVGHLLLADDPFEGIGGQHGRLTLNEQPGLGVVER